MKQRTRIPDYNPINLISSVKSLTLINLSIIYENLLCILTMLKDSQLDVFAYAGQRKLVSTGFPKKVPLKLGHIFQKPFF